MKYFLVFVVAIVAFQFVSVIASPDPEPGLLDGLVSGVGGIVSGAIDLVGKVLQALISVLSGLLTNDEKDSADAAADATNKEFDDIIKAARKTDCPVNRYDLDDAIKALKKIAAKLVTILASINEETLASYSDTIAADLKSGLKSLNDQVRVVVQIAVEDVLPRCRRDSATLKDLINAVIKAAGKVANAVQVRLFTLSMYDIHKRNITADASNVTLSLVDVWSQFGDNMGKLYSINAEITENVLTLNFDAYNINYDVTSLISWLNEIMLTNEQNSIQKTFEEAIPSIIAVVRAVILEVAKISPDLTPDQKVSIDGIVDAFFFAGAGIVNTIQTYLNPIALYDIYKDASLFPKPFKTSYTKRYVLYKGTRVLTYTNWKEAKQLCRNVGWEIASIESEAEKNVLVNLIASEGTEAVFWLGSTNVPTGNWRWIDAGKSITYTNWKPTEPNMPGSCMAMGLDSQWYDEDCTVEHAFVCQQPI